MAVSKSERDAVDGLTTQEVTKKVSVANAQCTQWANAVVELEADEDLGVLGYIPIVAGIQALSGVSDELIAAREAKQIWCDRREFYSAEMAKRRAAAPTVTAAAENEALRERQQQREDVRARSEASIEQAKTRTELGGAQTPIGGAVTQAGEAVTGAAETVAGWPERIKEGAFGTFGLAKDQPASERAVGLMRLALFAAGIYVVYLAGARFLGAAAPFAERGAQRTAQLTTKVMDMPLPPGAFG